MLKKSLAATVLLAVGMSALTACLDDATGVDCQPFSNQVTGNSGDTIETQIGLRYLQLAQGASQQESRWCSTLQVEYTGMLEDETEFDSGTLTFTPGVENLIPGFVFGVVGMRVGEQRRLFIPPNLGYGNQDVRDPQTGDVVIPANSDLIFDVELIATQ